MTGVAAHQRPAAGTHLMACAIALYFIVQGLGLALTESGDWGMGWVALSDARPATSWLIGLIAACGVLTAALAARLMARRDRWASHLSARRLSLAFVATVIGGTLLRPPLSEYAAGLVLTASIYGVELLLLAMIAMLIPQETAARVGARLAEARPWLPWLLAAWTLGMAILLGYVVFERMPHVPDEVAYLFQAKYFASGRLFLPPPPDAIAFELPHTLTTDKWFSIFPPGWPAVLAVGVMAGVPWLVNPLLGALAVVLLHRVAAAHYSTRIADLTTVLLAASPMFLLMSAGLMSHPLALVLALAAIGGIRWGVEAGRSGSAIIGGAALGGLVLTRPFEGALVAAVLGLRSVVRAGRGSRWRLALFAGVAIAVGAAMLPYNRTLTGRAFYDPIAKYFDERYYPGANRLGFGETVGNTGWNNDLAPGHGPLEAAANSHRNGYLLNLELFGWAIGSLAPIALFVLYGRWSSTDIFFAIFGVVIAGGMAAYWYSGADFGARYWYLVVVPAAMLAARGLEALAAVLGHGADRRAHVTGRIGVAIAVACASAVLLFVPWRAATKYHHYRGMGDGVAELARQHELDGALVFVRGAGRDDPFSRYGAAAVLNPALLDSGGAVYARELDAASRRRVECAFPGRPVRTIDTGRMPTRPPEMITGTEAVACAPSIHAELDR